MYSAFSPSNAARRCSRWKAAPGRFEGTAPGSSAPLLGAVRMGAEEKQALIQQGRLRIAPQSEYDYWLDVPDSFDSETH